MSASPVAYTKKDFMSDQTIRWCPGCGDYSILSQVQTAFATFPTPKEKYAVISGIGCSSRFPYYLSTFGFHTIHGRAPAVATGVKIANPELSVWVATGDGDALSIGGNHLIHVLRRNVDLKIMMFNNRIYGLTKGQYSPTSEFGKRTASTPLGSVDHPFEPLAVALGAGATFVARSVDVFPQHLRDVVGATAAHKGSAFLEIYQNCNIFNDGAFEGFTSKTSREDGVMYIEHGKPLIWGGAQKKGLVMRNLRLEIAVLGENGVTEADCVVHDETNSVLAWMLARLESPKFPVPVGVLYRVEKPTYETVIHEQIQKAKEKSGQGQIEKLIRGGELWKVG